MNDRSSRGSHKCFMNAVTKAQNFDKVPHDRIFRIYSQHMLKLIVYSAKWCAFAFKMGC